MELVPCMGKCPLGRDHLTDDLSSGLFANLEEALFGCKNFWHLYLGLPGLQTVKNKYLLTPQAVVSS